jgi:RHS repeat-associated protein
MLSCPVDAHGKQAGIDLTQWVYDPLGDQLAAMNGQTLVQGRVPLPGGAVAMYTYSSGPVLSAYWHTDWEGSVRFASTSTRTMWSDSAFAPFGEQYAAAGANWASYAGTIQDIVFGTYDATFRHYDPTSGRWLSPDPAGLGAVDLTNPQSLNRYAYVINNPLSFADPFGLFTIAVGTDSAGFPGELDCDPDASAAWFCFTQWLPVLSGGSAGGGGGGFTEQHPVISSSNQPPLDPCAVGGVPVPCPLSPPLALPPWIVLVPVYGQGPASQNAIWVALGGVSGVIAGLASTTYNSFANSNGCDRLLLSTFARDLSPVPVEANPSPAEAIAPGGRYLSIYTFNSALAYAATQPNAIGGSGLLYPFKSSVFRGLVDASKGFEEDVLPATIVYATVHSLYETISTASNYGCS